MGVISELIYALMSFWMTWLVSIKMERLGKKHACQTEIGLFAWHHWNIWHWLCDKQISPFWFFTIANVRKVNDSKPQLFNELLSNQILFDIRPVAAWTMPTTSIHHRTNKIGNKLFAEFDLSASKYVATFRRWQSRRQSWSTPSIETKVNYGAQQAKQHGLNIQLAVIKHK